jgi:hypothetical protein
VLTGGFVLFGAWISRAAREQRVLDLELLEAVRGRAGRAGPPALLLSDPTTTTPAQRRRRAAGSNGGGPSGDALVGDRPRLHAARPTARS